MKRMVAILLVGVLLPIAADAQEWQAYTYADPGFSIQFPAAPAVETSTIKDAFGETLPMTRYRVRQDGLRYTLSVVNYSRTNADALSTIGDTEHSFAKSGKVTATSGARINRHVGRQLTVDGADGSRSAIAIFFVDKHLYTVVCETSPSNAPGASADAIRFQQSLRFTDDDSGFGGFAGLGGLFGGKGADSTKSTNDKVVSTKVAGNKDSGNRGADTVHADATCAGKSAGDAVQLKTPGGPVAAICTLVARPLP